ncbi:hypothetical protein ACQP1G_20890 [Nocardia sp. CA-107356]|uniref:hypothetical protein n=1 Tax=Nocardia sp. CA-107356 TaxID=3239972 RepID=UPI003D9443B0
MWTNNLVQFARLVAELEAAGAFTEEIMGCVAASMDVTSQDVIELKDRAVRIWQEAVARANSPTGRDDLAAPDCPELAGDPCGVGGL